MSFYGNGFNKHLHVQRDEFIEGVEKAQSVKDLCQILGKSKPSVYTYAYRFGIPLKGRWVSGIRKADGYYHYNNDLNHRRILEKYLERQLTPEESVHHIDGNKLNNKINNLFITSKSEHQKIHHSLEECAFKMFEMGLVKFDSEDKRYYLDLKGK